MKGSGSSAALMFLASCALALTGCGLKYEGNGTVRPVARLDDKGVFVPGRHGREGFFVSMIELHPQDRFAGDIQELRVVALDGRTIARERVCTSYGIYRIDAIDLTGDGMDELVCVFGEARGTSVRMEDLVVKQIVGNTLVDLLRTERSGYYWADARWWYDYEYRDLNGDGIADIRMTLQHEPITERLRTVADGIPFAKVKELCWNQRGRKMTLRWTQSREGTSPGDVSKEEAFIPVAYTGDADFEAQDRAGQALLRHGIHCYCEGPKVISVFVPRKDALRAVSILKADAEKQGYGMTFAESKDAR